MTIEKSHSMKNLHWHVDMNYPFEVCTQETQNGSEFTVKSTTPLTRLYHYFDRDYHKNQASQTNHIVSNLLKNEKRITPLESSTHALTKLARTVLKKTGQQRNKDLSSEILKKELTAFKLGIPREAFDNAQNEGFYNFAIDPPLDRYLLEFNHKLTISQSGEIQILKDGVYRPWSQVKEFLTKPVNQDPETYQAWFYGENGIQNKNMFEWTELSPYKKGDPKEWDGKYIFEVCCCCESAPRFVGDHTWLRLKTPEGDIYSVGLYRPITAKGQANNNLLRIRKGILMQPDVSEFYPTGIYRVPFEITKEEFDRMKTQIESDKATDKEILEAFGRNCTHYVEKIGKIANIDIDVEKPVWRLLLQKYKFHRIIHTVDTAKKVLPSPVSHLSAKIASFWCTTMLTIAGARKVDQEILRKGQTGVVSKFEKITDFFDPNKCKVKHPHSIGHDFYKQISKLREKRIQQIKKEILEEQEKINEIKRIKYAKPSELIN